jgi:hypothetical protein
MLQTIIADDAGREIMDFSTSIRSRDSPPAQTRTRKPYRVILILAADAKWKTIYKNVKATVDIAASEPEYGSYAPTLITYNVTRATEGAFFKEVRVQTMGGTKRVIMMFPK